MSLFKYCLSNDSIVLFCLQNYHSIQAFVNIYQPFTCTGRFIFILLFEQLLNLCIAKYLKWNLM